MLNESTEKLTGLPKAHQPHPLDSALVESFAAAGPVFVKRDNNDFVDYQLTLRIPIDAVDNMMARSITRNIMLLIGNKVSLKLQRMHKDKPPEAVSLK